jgi:hypothetical protein
MSKWIRLELVIDKNLDDQLDGWATEIASDKAEVLLRALRLYDVAIQAHQRGERLAILNGDFQPVRDIVGI